MFTLNRLAASEGAAIQSDMKDVVGVALSLASVLALSSLKMLGAF